MFLARMVMPRSRSSSFESITRSTWCSLERKVPLCCSMASTSVVLPWSTWAMMAMLRMPELKKDPSRNMVLLPLYYEEMKRLRMTAGFVSSRGLMWGDLTRRARPSSEARHLPSCSSPSTLAFD